MGARFLQLPIDDVEHVDARRARGGGVREGRRPNELRPLEIEIDYLEQPHGAVLWSQGKTKVLCTASIEEGVPRWLRNSGPRLDDGRVLDAARVDRRARRARGAQGQAGRAHDRDPAPDRPGASRGRPTSRRSASGRSTSTATCSRPTAARAARRSAARTSPRGARSTASGSRKALTGSVAAVSVGIVDGEPLLDLEYTEDSTAEVDMNVVMTGDGRLVEVQATAEGEPFTRDELDALLDLAARGDRARSPRRSARRSRRALAVAAVPTLGWDDDLLRLALAAALGGAIGFERELREREAGLRTHLLVCLGSALFTIVSAYGFHEFLTSGDAVVRADPTRIAAQIVTGIGFLGAGAIIRQGISVRGLTTAATLWVAAAIGMAAGAGYYPGAVIGTVAHARRALAAAPRRVPDVRAAPARGAERRRRPAPGRERGAAARRARATSTRASSTSSSRTSTTGASSRSTLDTPSEKLLRDARRSRVRAGRRVEPVARLCSKNEGKLRELRAALPGWEIELLDADDYPPEDGRDVLRERAREGATSAARSSPTSG